MPSRTNQLQALAFEHIVPELHDNVYSSIPLLKRFYDRNVIKNAGFTEWQVPVYLSDPGNAEWISGYDLIDTTPWDVIQNTSLNMKLLRSAVTISQEELNKAEKNGSKVLSLVEAKFQIAENDMRNKLATSLFSDGTGSSSNEFVGLKAAIDDGTVATTYANINRSTYANWSANVDTSTTTLSFSALQTKFSNCIYGADAPTLGVTTQARWNTMWGLLVPSQRIVDTNKLGVGTSTGVEFNGVEVIWDSKCSASHFYWLNEKYIDFVVLTSEDMTIGEFQEPTDQDAFSAKLRWTGLLMVKQPRTSAKFTALAA